MPASSTLTTQSVAQKLWDILDITRPPEEDIPWDADTLALILAKENLAGPAKAGVWAPALLDSYLTPGLVLKLRKDTAWIALLIKLKNLHLDQLQEINNYLDSSFIALNLVPRFPTDSPRIEAAFSGFEKALDSYFTSLQLEPGCNLRQVAPYLATLKSHYAREAILEEVLAAKRALLQEIHDILLYKVRRHLEYLDLETEALEAAKPNPFPRLSR